MAAKHNPPLVLVADDDPQISVMLRRIFEREGYEVENVDNGITALEYAARLLPDLIILDVRMPQMSGFDVLRQLRENAVTASIPTIIVTAKAREPTDLAHGLGLGADDYLYKPFDLRELLARAQSKMKARQLEDALHRRTQELEALLRISEELNQYLEVNELLDLILYLMLDLLPGDIAAIYRFDKNS
ncbi:MAG: response regulator, partial [Burkholderiales bacterium]|nr:response regulator [Anaerolineae bacterium]